MVDEETLRKRYFVESITWKVLRINLPLFSYVQDPVYNLTTIEELLIEFLHIHGLNFQIQPRFNPAKPIIIDVTIKDRTQQVRINCISGLSSSCTFITKRTPFAADFKGWLDRTLGTERFDQLGYLSTAHWVYYPYVLPLYETVVGKFGIENPVLPEDSRHISYFFNFNDKEKEFLKLLEDAVSKNKGSADPLEVKVYPRITHTGSIELIIRNSQGKQPVRIFSSGSHPVTYQIITVNGKLNEPLKNCIDSALGADSFDKASSRMSGKMVSLIYTHRSPNSIEFLFTDD